MKRISFIAALSGLSFVTVSAQDNQTIRNDHTYSTHNYKHANKAATARQWENKSGTSVRAPGLGTSPLANYKHPVPGAAPVGGVVMPHTPETDVAHRNYKIQRVSLPNSTTGMMAKSGNPTLGTLDDQAQKLGRLVELNIQEQVCNLTSTSLVQNAWGRGNPLQIHGLIYDIKTGLLKDLQLSKDNAGVVDIVYRLEAILP